MKLSLLSFHQRLKGGILRAFRKRVVVDVNSSRNAFSRTALVYFKTESLSKGASRMTSRHANETEPAVIAEVLGSLGFRVDLVDREASKRSLTKLPNSEYDLLISNCAGNSAPLHHLITRKFYFKRIIAYSMGPDPELSVRLNLARHRNFRLRTGVTPTLRRVVAGDKYDWEKRFADATAIVVNGEPNTFSWNSYKKYGKPIYFVPSIISEKLATDVRELSVDRSPTSFVYFGGNGLICKGLDLVLEAFDGLHDFRLDIFGPESEADFWGHYEPLLERNPQITFHGFVSPLSERFRSVADRATFSIFPGSSEGCATSVLTTMRLGLIPLATWETGLDLRQFGLRIENDELAPDKLRARVRKVSELPEVERKQLHRNAYEASLLYTKVNFKLALENVLQEMFGESPA